MNACEMCTIAYRVVFLIRSNIEFALFIYEGKEVSDRGERRGEGKKEYYKGEEVKGERGALIFNARRMAKFHGVIKKLSEVYSRTSFTARWSTVFYAQHYD